MNELASFAGAGGGILGGKLLGWRTVCAVECEPYPASVLAQRQKDGLLPPFPIWDDVRTFDGKPWRGIVDVVSGGFPCQDISAAGKGAGITGERSGLWMEMARIISEVRPRFAFVENSPTLTSRGLGVVLGDLATHHTRNCTGMDGGSNSRRAMKKRFAMPTSTANQLAPSMMKHPGCAAIWPTIRSSDADRGGRGDLIQAVRGNENSHYKLFPTPRANDAEKRGEFDINNRRNGLPAMVKRMESSSKIFSTPTANDWKGPNYSGSGSASSRGLATSCGGQLNPMWVEWLMGWPLGWTDFAPLETAKSRNARRKHGGY